MLFVAAQVMSWWIGRPGLPHYAEKISQYLQLQEGKVQRYFEEEDLFVQLHLQHRRNYQALSKDYFSLLEQMAKEEFAVYLLNGDSIIAWNHNQIRIPPKWLPSQLHAEGPIFASSRNGFFSLYYRDIVLANDTLTLLAAVPIKKMFPLESPYLASGFTADLLIPTSIELSSGEGVPVKNSQGQVFCFIKSDQGLMDPVRQTWVLICFALAFLLLGISFNKVAIIIGKKYRYLYGLSIVLLTALGIRHAILRLLFGEANVWNLFTADLAPDHWNKSLLDIVISSLLLFWSATFCHREFVAFYPIPKPKWGRWLMAGSAFLLILTALTLTNLQFKNLIEHSGLEFDFHIIFNLDSSSFVAICCLLLILIALFFFSHRLILSVFELALNRRARFLVALATMAISLPILEQLNLPLDAFILCFTSLIFIVILELFIENKISSLTSLVFWLFLCAGYAAILLYQYKLEKDLDTQLAYAQALATPSDLIAEPQIFLLGKEVVRDTNILGQLARSSPDSVFPAQAWRALIDQKLIEKNYLFNNYKYDFFIFQEGGNPIYFSETNAKTIWKRYQDTTSYEATSFENLYLIPSYDEVSNYLYIDTISVRGPADPLTYILSFKFKEPTPSKVYTELLLDAPYKNLRELQRFDYAVFQGRRTIFFNGNPTEELLLQAQKLKAHTWDDSFTSTRSDIYYKGDHNLSVVIGKAIGGYTKPWSLFSYLFALFILMVLVIALFDFWFPSLPPKLGFRLRGRQSLRNRIQLAVIALVLGSFIIIGLVTVTFFSRSSDNYHSSRLNRKVSTIQQDIQRDLAKYPRNWPSAFNLEALVVAISNIHNMDINYFDLNGRLLSSSTRFIFDRNIVAPLMNPIALKALKQPTVTSIYIDEEIGGLAYRSAYVPLRNGQREIVAYLGLPYYSEGRNLRTDLYDFMGTLLNVYVLLLLVAGVIAIVVANSVTNPIAKIGEKLSRFELGQSEPLEWKNKDEIGQLIAEYNQMIRKLEESTAKLKQSEREGAWREMAKQVAHEIKNPLTPMKLSIQHLMRVQQTQPERAAEMMEKVAGNLIEQIENLSRIASEFSNFAKMPRANRQVLRLNEVINSVYQIFRKTPDDSVLLYMELQEEPIEVFADKGQIIQVLNNLIKNAIQAIPDDRQGKISLQLLRKEDTAFILVEDNGSGIPKAMLEKVFSPNFTTKTSGMGLGLAISKNIIDATGGQIYFTTKANQGTTFYIELPIYKE